MQARDLGATPGQQAHVLRELALQEGHGVRAAHAQHGEVIEVGERKIWHGVGSAWDA